ncbi:nucleoside triphosphate pyrophosphohydrolase [Rhodococcoides kyotonense]|uniref:nucleoside triphosphate pyrophosphohydrolase n=1 Tax=Rhodococcoides kyotonense TaxID=398843 RepID=UPI00083927E0|nr:nucleoside triphosphate pyrophosphohydrolase [Rhodococcus kyotonensis]
MGKLVRDLIPSIIEASGRRPEVRVLDGDEYLAALTDKLFEEAREFQAADTTDKPEELADVLEVVRALAASIGLGVTELEALADKKRVERGGFVERVWLERSVHGRAATRPVRGKLVPGPTFRARAAQPH